MTISKETLSNQLRAAAKNGDLRGLISATEKGALLDCQNADKFGMTALMYATWFENTSCVEWLLNAGASVNLQDKHGRTVLHLAVINGCTLFVEPLLKAGATIAVHDRYKNTALDLAINMGYDEIAGILQDFIVKQQKAALKADNNLIIPSKVKPSHRL